MSALSHDHPYRQALRNRQALRDEIKRLRATNADMMAALEAVAAVGDGPMSLAAILAVMDMVDAAIAKARNQGPSADQE